VNRRSVKIHTFYYMEPALKHAAWMCHKYGPGTCAVVWRDVTKCAEFATNDAGQVDMVLLDAKAWD
jgi:hypothetical protein